MYVTDKRTAVMARVSLLQVFIEQNMMTPYDRNVLTIYARWLWESIGQYWVPFTRPTLLGFFVVVIWKKAFGWTIVMPVISYAINFMLCQWHHFDASHTLRMIKGSVSKKLQICRLSWLRNFQRLGFIAIKQFLIQHS